MWDRKSSSKDFSPASYCHLRSSCGAQDSFWSDCVLQTNKQICFLDPKECFCGARFYIESGALQFHILCLMKACLLSSQGHCSDAFTYRGTYFFLLLTFHKMLFLFLSTSSACFQLLQSLLKYTPITFSLTSLKVKVTCAPHTTDVAVMDVLGCVACGLLVQLPQRCRISAFPEKFTHLHIGIGENLTDGFQVRSPGSENGSDLPLVTYPVGSRTRVTVLVYLLFLPSLENYRSGNQVKGETRVCTDSRARQDLSWMAGGGTHESHFPSSFHCLMKKMGIWLMLPVC